MQMEEWTKDEKYCLETIAEIREEMGLKSTTSARWDAISRTLGLMFLHGNDRTSHCARSTLQEVMMRRILLGHEL